MHLIGERLVDEATWQMHLKSHQQKTEAMKTREAVRQHVQSKATGVSFAPKPAATTTSTRSRPRANPLQAIQRRANASKTSSKFSALKQQAVVMAQATEKTSDSLRMTELPKAPAPKLKSNPVQKTLKDIVSKHVKPTIVDKFKSMVPK